MDTRLLSSAPIKRCTQRHHSRRYSTVENKDVIDTKNPAGLVLYQTKIETYIPEDKSKKERFWIEGFKWNWRWTLLMLG